MKRRWWRIPPVWVRRVVLAPLVVVAAFLWLAVAVWLVAAVAVIVSWALPGRLRLTRVVWLAGVYLMWDAVALVALAVLGLRHGWTRFRSPASQRDHFALAGVMLRVLFAQVRWALRLEVDTEDAELDGIAPGRPLIVVCRHAGPGDSFVMVEALFNRFGRHPAVVLKDTLQWDPAIDIMLHRIPSRFITPRRLRAVGAPGGREAIAELARDMGPDGALLIFPEGANATPRRRRRRIDALRAAGQDALADRAESFGHLMPPHPGGVLAAMEARPDAVVVMVAHTGLERFTTVADVWRELPVDKRIVIKGWTAEPGSVPEGRQAREEWLYAWWSRVDAWVDAHELEVSALAERRRGARGR